VAVHKSCEQAAVVSNLAVARGYNVLTVECPPIASAAVPGQFALLRSSLPGMPLLSRPFSIYSADPETGQVEFLIKEVGTATRLLCSEPVGAQVLIVGPLGQPFNEPESKSALLVGGGTGVGPLAFFAERMAGRLTMEAIVGAPSQEYVFGRERFLRAGAALRVATEDGSDGEKGLPTELLAQRLSERATHASPLHVDAGGVLPRDAKRETGSATAVFACGPLAMLAEVARICREAGAECQVSLENQLGCGLGACYGCVVPILTGDGSSGWGRVCTDGPVFRAERIDWKRLPPELTAD